MFRRGSLAEDGGLRGIKTEAKWLSRPWQAFQLRECGLARQLAWEHGEFLGRLQELPEAGSSGKAERQPAGLPDSQLPRRGLRGPAGAASC